MAYSNLFVDSDIILDLFLQREPYSKFTQILLAQSKIDGFILNTSTLIIANLNYVLTGRVGKLKVKESIMIISEEMNVLPFEKDIITLAINSSFTDFEDSLQHFIAQKYHCDLIITRNTKDYKHSAIPILTAEQFLQTL
ncbi:PIN domain-containing protein [Mucilaginibacter terrae]|uniref:PIN domain-containing protein n=1 Tax=Mucilaginibacter terrae TaxID=1955052 RepID=UPI003627AACB